MHDGRQQRRCRAKPSDRIGWHGLQPSRHHRIGRPDKGRDEGGSQAGDLPRRKAGAIAGEQQDGAGEPQQRADDVMRKQPLARQQRGEQHDQQRPEIIEQARFRRRCKTQRQKIQRVIAEQPADADDPDDKRLLQGVEGGRPEDEAGERDGSADRKCHRRELERRDFSGRNRKHG